MLGFSANTRRVFLTSFFKRYVFSSASSRISSAQSGFTLIELMAVMLIVGMIMSVVSVSIGDGNRGRKIQSQSRALYQSMQLLLEEAVFARRQLGIRFDVDNSASVDQWEYSFLFYDDDERRWYGLETEELSPQQFLIGVNITLELEGEEIFLGDIEKDNSLFSVNDKLKEDERVEPDIYFLSSGETPNFILNIVDEGIENAPLASDFEEPKVFTITGNLLGQVRFLLPGEDREGNE